MTTSSTNGFNLNKKPSNRGLFNLEWNNGIKQFSSAWKAKVQSIYQSRRKTSNRDVLRLLTIMLSVREGFEPSSIQLIRLTFVQLKFTHRLIYSKKSDRRPYFGRAAIKKRRSEIHYYTKIESTTNGCKSGAHHPTGLPIFPPSKITGLPFTNFASFDANTAASAQF